MKKFFLFFFLLMLALTVSSTSYANKIANGDFETLTGTTSTTVVSIGTRSALGSPAHIFANQTYTVGSNEGIWLDRRQWVQAHGVNDFDPDAPSGYSPNYFAYHAYQGGSHSDLLAQGFSGSSYSAGDIFTLSFDYILADLVDNVTFNPGSASVYVLGFGTGGTFQGVAAPWQYQFDSGSSAVNFESYVSSNTENVLINESLGSTSGWQPWSQSFTLDKNYEALAVIFKFAVNSSDSFQGIDNVSVSAVPEPATMLLLTGGLAGLAGFRKRFKKH